MQHILTRDAAGSRRKLDGGDAMRAFKVGLALILVFGGATITALTYLQSHGAGISTGCLMLLIIIAYTYDHRHHIFGLDLPSAGKRPSAQSVAMHQGRLTAMRQEGDIGAR